MYCRLFGPAAFLHHSGLDHTLHTVKPSWKGFRIDQKAYLCIADIPLFSGLDRTAFTVVCAASRRLSLGKGEYLFREGDPADTIYVIKAGSFKLVKHTETEDEVILHIAGIGEILGETALFQTSRQQPASAVALEPSKACGLDRKTFSRIIQEHPDIAVRIIENLGTRLYSFMEHISDLSSFTAQERVLSLLLRLCRRHGEPCEQGIKLTLRLTQEEIASLVGVSRVMVSKVLKELGALDYVTRTNGHYVIKNHCF